MAASSKRSWHGEDRVDRLSSLDDSVLHHILGFLENPLEVRTCVLSKRWTHLWRSLHNLSFCEGSFLYYNRDSQMDHSFTDFVNQVLIRRDNCRLHKLSFSVLSLIKPCLVESLLDYALKHGVQEIELHLPIGSDKDEDEPSVPPCRFVWPRRSFNCPSLQKLVLMVSEVSYIGFPRHLAFTALKSLFMSGQRFSKDHVDGSFFPRCPNLEDLRLFNIISDDELEIVAPCLRTLEFLFLVSFPPDSKVVIIAPRLTTFKFWGSLPMVCSADAPSLEDVHIDLVPSTFTVDDDFVLNSIKMVNEFRVARSMTVTANTIKVLCANPGLLDGHLSKFENLKCLTVKKDPHEDFGSFPPCLTNYFLNGSTQLKFLQRKW